MQTLNDEISGLENGTFIESAKNIKKLAKSFKQNVARDIKNKKEVTFNFNENTVNNKVFVPKDVIKNLAITSRNTIIKNLELELQELLNVEASENLSEDNRKNIEKELAKAEKDMYLNQKRLQSVKIQVRASKRKLARSIQNVTNRYNYIQKMKETTNLEEEKNRSVKTAGSTESISSEF